ncbi:hypothetical protein GBAR_LOCUS31429 [Geodia barretti]|uniref:Fibronectin type-III domain-containing protein n=1 Tax=Geodia barretti TaxID=519541 RepID=A0AA35U2U9_GEOBA|nr:hypothetical protein GBAR_LOCUS31429 [Geodia barretti]
MVDSVTPTSISISWTSGGSEGVSYFVEWQRDTSEDQGTVTIIDGSTSYVISGLEENSRYIIRVTASNAIGSEESDPVIGVTASQDIDTGCPYGPDEIWGIIWPNTAVGTVNAQPCPGGVDTLGILS